MPIRSQESRGLRGGGETASVSTADRLPVTVSEVGRLLILLTASHLAHRLGGEVLMLPRLEQQYSLLTSHYAITLRYRAADVQPRKSELFLGVSLDLTLSSRTGTSQEPSAHTTVVLLPVSQEFVTQSH